MSNNDNSLRYRRIHACLAEFFHTCYYCGDIASTDDFIPPKTRSQTSGSYPDGQFFIVPCCPECKRLGGDQPHSHIETRSEYIRKALRKKHYATFKKTQLWTQEEVALRIEEDGLTSINRSLLAVLNAEQDLTSRLNFTGYDFEVDGSRYQSVIEEKGQTSVFGQLYDNPKQALHAVAKQYSLKVAELHQQSEIHNGNIELAAETLITEHRQRQQEKQLKELATELSVRYKQPKQWLIRSLTSLAKQSPDANLEMISKILIERYFSR
ncbi:hypothetical protein EDC56_1885 [Sinobacterium caligoides]|uniref:Uncharacterized protein n=1 Tax=Sinobacterium caligoides TaxID=933926 RepID=A0A3N2DNQ6_9GAMM|nr:hypothetical protein [Sinobacterium caligoides]ROS01444.1 hypothetical protein EDC56_1885 [Sinobacterium caligoides]